MNFMKKPHDAGGKPKRVAEPVQVYLDTEQRDQLERLSASLGLSRSDVLRRGLAALEFLSSQAARGRGKRIPLPIYRGRGLQPGVDLDDSASLLDLMDSGNDPP